MVMILIDVSELHCMLVCLLNYWVLFEQNGCSEFLMVGPPK